MNSTESNPICRFCIDPDTPRVRCIDNIEYSHRWDKAVKDCFNEFKRSGIKHDEVGGLTLLDENPFAYCAEKDGFQN